MNLPLIQAALELIRLETEMGEHLAYLQQQGGEIGPLLKEAHLKKREKLANAHQKMRELLPDPNILPEELPIQAALKDQKPMSPLAVFTRLTQLGFLPHMHEVSHMLWEMAQAGEIEYLNPGLYKAHKPKSRFHDLFASVHQPGDMPKTLIERLTVEALGWPKEFEQEIKDFRKLNTESRIQAAGAFLFNWPED